MNKNSNLKILKNHNVVENFGCVRDNIDVNSDIVNVDVNLNVNSTNIINRFTQCNQLPNSTLRRLCSFRCKNDNIYSNWVATGRAWWFTCYPSNRRITMGFGWESDSVKYPLPTWWWRYPEIPAPSIEWLSQNFQLNGEMVRKRNYYLPRPNVNIPRRVDLRIYNQNCNNLEDNIQEVDININELLNSKYTVNETITDISPNNNNTYWCQGYPVNTIERFDNVSGPNQSYLILFIVIMIILAIFIFAYNRAK